MQRRGRAKGEGTVYPVMRSGHVSYMAQRVINKTRIQARGATEGQAWARLEKKVREFQGGTYVKRQTPPRPQRARPVRRRSTSNPRGEWTYKEFCYWWHQRRTVSPEFADKELRTLRLHIFPKIGDKKLNEITKAVLREFLESLWTSSETANQKGLHNNVWKLLSKTLNYAVNQDALEVNPLLGVSRTKEKKKKRPAELKRRAGVLKKMMFRMKQVGWDKANPLDNAMLHVNVLGLRTAELVGLDREDVDLKNGLLTVRQQFTRETIKNKSVLKIKDGTKTGDERFVPIPSATRLALEAYMSLEIPDPPKKHAEFSSLLFRSPKTGSPIEPNRWRDMFRSYLEDFYYSRIPTEESGHRAAYLQAHPEEDPEDIDKDKFRDFCDDPVDPATGKQVLAPYKPEYFPPTYLRKISITWLTEAGLDSSLAGQIFGNTEGVREAHYLLAETRKQAPFIEQFSKSFSIDEGGDLDEYKDAFKHAYPQSGYAKIKRDEEKLKQMTEEPQDDQSPDDQRIKQDIIDHIAEMTREEIAELLADL